MGMEMGATRANKVLVTGANGFIGLHLTEKLLADGYNVVALDWEGHNLLKVKSDLNARYPGALRYINGDVRNLDVCLQACDGVDTVFHHAAIASVPASFSDPSLTDSVNVGGFITLMRAASHCCVRRFIYASSSAVYGNNETLPLSEDAITCPVSPYGVSKLANEMYAATLAKTLKLDVIGFRYFNVYGPRQNPNGSYAAVIPKWLAAVRLGQPITLFGDGTSTRDFCYIDDLVRANIAAMTIPNPDSQGQVYNVGTGIGTSLNELIKVIKKLDGTAVVEAKPEREGDIKHSVSDITKLKALLKVNMHTTLEQGIKNLIMS